MKKKTKRKPKIGTKKLKAALDGLKSTVEDALAEGDPEAAAEEHLPNLRSAVYELREAVLSFKWEIKRRMLADNLVTPTIGKPYLKLRPGRPEGSKDPDDYDVVYERIH